MMNNNTRRTLQGMHDKLVCKRDRCIRTGAQQCIQLSLQLEIDAVYAVLEADWLEFSSPKPKAR